MRVGYRHLSSSLRHARPTDYFAEEGLVTPAKAHNELLQLLATQGILGAVAAALLLAGLARAAWLAWRRATLADRPLVVAVAAAVVAFLVQGLFGFTVTGIGTLFVTLAALLSRWSDPVRTTAAESSRIGPLFSSRLLWIGRVAVVGCARQRSVVRRRSPHVVERRLC